MKASSSSYCKAHKFCKMHPQIISETIWDSFRTVISRSLRNILFKCPYTCSTIYLATDSIWLNIHCSALTLPLSRKSVIKQFLHEQALSAIINFQCMTHCLSALSNKRISENTCILGAPRPTRVSISYQHVTVCSNLHILEKAIR